MVKYVLQFVSYTDVEFLVSRSQGAGGQHVNKTNSSVQLRFSIESSRFTFDDKQKIIKKLSHKLIQGDILQIRSEEERDQKTNKDMAYKKLIHLLAYALTEPKARKKTKPTKSSVRKRLDGKKIKSDIKKERSRKYF